MRSASWWTVRRQYDSRVIRGPRSTPERHRARHITTPDSSSAHPEDLDLFAHRVIALRRGLSSPVSPHQPKSTPATVQSLAGGPTLHVLEARDQPRSPARCAAPGGLPRGRQRRVHPAPVVFPVVRANNLRLHLRRNLAARRPRVGRKPVHGRVDVLKPGHAIAHRLTGEGLEERAAPRSTRLRCRLEDDAPRIRDEPETATGLLIADVLAPGLAAIALPVKNPDRPQARSSTSRSRTVEDARAKTISLPPRCGPRQEGARRRGRSTKEEEGADALEELDIVRDILRSLR